MSNDKMQYPERAGDVGTLLAWLKNFFGHFRLAWELLWDSRVPFVSKLVPLLTVIYMLSPVDFIPDVALGLGQLDDLAVFLIGMRLFVDVCPPALVAEHRETAQLEMTAAPSTEKSTGAPQPPLSGQVIDVEAKVIDAGSDGPEEKSKPAIPHVW